MSGQTYHLVVDALVAIPALMLVLVLILTTLGVVAHVAVA